MRGAIRRRLMLAAWVGLAGALPGLADLADVYRRQGSPLRGEVSWTASEIIIRNAAGAVHLRKEQVARVEWIDPAASVDADFLRRFSVLAERDVEGHYALAEWVRGQQRYDLLKKQCNYILGLEPDHRNAKLLLELAQRELVKQTNVRQAGQRPAQAAAPAGAAGLAEPPLLSAADIKRLKLYEFPLDAPPERVHVRFLRKKGYAELERVIRAELGRRDQLDSDADQILQQGTPEQKLQLLLRASGLKYADRVEIRGEPRVFQTFRRRILPLVVRGCAKSGCHGQRGARVFRLPAGPRSRDAVVYTSFLILDRLTTRYGPLIDRDLPGHSALLGFMLPAEDNEQPHPPVRQGRLVPLIRHTRDRNYQVVLEWLSALSVPHPQYELAYEYPAWLRPPAAQQPPQTQPAAPGAPRQAGARPAPQTRPVARPGRGPPGGG